MQFTIDFTGRFQPSTTRTAPAVPERTGVAFATQRFPELMKLHGLTAKGWTWGFDNAKRRAGACNYSRKRITIARGYALVAKNAEIEDTILHEIAHAIAGHAAGHGPAWKAVARSIGCSAERCHTVEFTAPKFLVECPNGCFPPAKRQRRPRRQSVCRRCRTPVTVRAA